MQELLNGEVRTTNGDSGDQTPKNKSKQGLVVIVGGYNSFNANMVIQVNGDTLSAIATGLQNLSLEAVKEILDPIGEILQAAGVAITKAKL